VSFELAHAPRTWHLDQPDVAVAGGRVTLRGSVPGDDAREELARVAGAVPGVAGVDNLVTVAPVATDLA
jgi:osmotically-inducible protein OsmY